jgi:hypothetical protein
MTDDTIEALATAITFIRQDTAEIKVDIKSLSEKIDKNYLTCKQFNAEFSPVRNIVYGLVGIVLTALASGVIYLLFNHGAIK